MTTSNIEAAIRRAFALGQTYWEQSESDSLKQNKKADETLARLDALVAETLAAVVPASRAAIEAAQEPACPSNRSDGLDDHTHALPADPMHTFAAVPATPDPKRFIGIDPLKAAAPSLKAPQEPALLHPGELPGTEGLWFDERGRYYRRNPSHE